MTLIMNKDVSPESLGDLGEDVYDAINAVDLPKDRHGFEKGIYRVRIEFIPDAEVEND